MSLNSLSDSPVDHAAESAKLGRPVVIGCGNLARSDDGVGCHVIRALQRQMMPSCDAKLLDAGTDGMMVMYAARGADAMIVIDACRGIGRPGEIFDIPGDVINNPAPEQINTHALRWDHVVHAARQILGKEFPSDFRVFLIEVASTDLGLELTAPVEKAARKLVRLVENRLAAK